MWLAHPDGVHDEDHVLERLERGLGERVVGRRGQQRALHAQHARPHLRERAAPAQRRQVLQEHLQIHSHYKFTPDNLLLYRVKGLCVLARKTAE